MKRLLLLVALLGLVGCASTQIVGASTPRSVEIHGPDFSSEDGRKAFDLAQAECQKHSRHASLRRNWGTRLEGRWTFDCIL